MGGTELSVVQDGIPEVIPLEMCYLGWQDSLAQLATLVEPDIPSSHRWRDEPGPARTRGAARLSGR